MKKIFLAIFLALSIPSTHYENVTIKEVKQDKFIKGQQIAAIQKGNTIYLYNSWKPHHLIHEIGHVYCDKIGNPKPFGTGKREDRVSDYAMTNKYEDCAETYSAYYHQTFNNVKLSKILQSKFNQICCKN